MIVGLSAVPRVLLVISAFIVTLAADGPTRPASADAIRPLVRAFNVTQQRAIAAPDAEPGFFVAALYTGTDLFLVRARHPDISGRAMCNQWLAF